jgi:DNA-binding CsgD family transcriptional regulator
MYLNDRQLRVLSHISATLAEPYSEYDVRQQLGQQLLELLDAQYFASYVWNAGEGQFRDRVNINMSPDNLLLYEKYYQFHDPITPAMQTSRQAIRVTDVITHERLRKTEFYNDFLKRDGLYHGVNLYAWDGDQNIGDLRIWRDHRRDNFSQEDLRLLEFLRPAFVAALRRARRHTTQSLESEVVTQRRAKLLSLREQEVAELASIGMSDKEISKQLNISVTTVRTHLKHAFEKLAVDNRVKLAHSIQYAN